MMHHGMHLHCGVEIVVDIFLKNITSTVSVAL